MMYRYENDDLYDFKKKRELYLINIRKRNREDIISRHRYSMENRIEQQSQLQHIGDSRYAHQIKKFYSEIYDAVHFQDYMKMIDSSFYLTKVQGIIAMKYILNQVPFHSEKGKLIISMITTQKILKFISFIHLKDHPQLKYQAIAMLTSITYPQQNIVSQAFNNIIIKLAMQLLNQCQYNTIEVAILLAVNMASISNNCRNALVNLGIFQTLIKILHSTQKKSTYLKCLWAITLLIRHKQSSNMLVEEVFDILCEEMNNKIFHQMLKQQVFEIFENIIWTLLFMVKKADNSSQKLIKSGALPIIMDCLVSSNQSICLPAIKILGKIINQQYIDLFIDNGILNLVLRLLYHQKKKIRLETCWIISNLAGGSSQQISKLIAKKDIFDKISQMFHTDQLAIKEEICWIYPNLHNYENKNELMDIYLHYDIIKNYVQLLDNQNITLIETSLKCLLKLFKIGRKVLFNGNNILLMKFIEYGGTTKLERLQEHESNQIYSAVVQILANFFQVSIEC